MKYKIGDKIQLKKLDEFDPTVIKCINRLKNRVATVNKVLFYDNASQDGLRSHYLMKEIAWPWFEDEVEDINIEKVNRFELMDI